MFILSRFLPGGLVLTVLMLASACRQEGPPPPVAIPVAAAPAPEKKKAAIEIHPFPDPFRLAAQDLPHFSGSARFDGEVRRHKNLSVIPVADRRFGCYTLDDSTMRWTPQMADFCPEGGDFYVHQEITRHGKYVFAALYPAGAEYPPALLTAWEVRGDSLDFVAILDVAFESEGPYTVMTVNALQKRSGGRYRLSGQLQWQAEGTSKTVSRPWSADWIPPHHLVLR